MECAHDVVLNGACFYCGSTDLTPQKRPDPTIVPARDLRRERREDEPRRDSAGPAADRAPET